MKQLTLAGALLPAAILLALSACGTSPAASHAAAPADDTAMDGAATSDAETGATPAAPADMPMADGAPDVKVPGTDYNATSDIPCSVDGGKSEGTCPAGVKRNWGEAGEALVEVTKPDGLKRAIFFKGVEATGADSSQADGSAGWDFKASRKGDVTTIEYGPERYTIVDAFVEGG